MLYPFHTNCGDVLRVRSYATPEKVLEKKMAELPWIGFTRKELRSQALNGSSVTLHLDPDEWGTIPVTVSEKEGGIPYTRASFEATYGSVQLIAVQRITMPQLDNCGRVLKNHGYIAEYLLKAIYTDRAIIWPDYGDGDTLVKLHAVRYSPLPPLSESSTEH